MRSIADKLRTLARLPIRGWRRIVGLVAPDLPDAPSGLIARTRYRLAFYRTLAAPRWRFAVRAAIVVFGFTCYFGLQLGLAYGITKIDVMPLAWVLITAFFVVSICVALAAAKPTFCFIAWLVLSPLGFIFLRMDFGAGLPAITFDRIVIGALAMLLVARTLLNRQPIKAPLVGEWLILGFIGYTAVSVFALHPGDLKFTLQIISDRFDHIVLAVVVYYVAKAVLITKQQVKWAIIGLAIAGFYTALSAFYEHYTGTKWFSSFLPGHYNLGWGDVGMGRASGPLINPAAAGTFLGITAFLTLHLGAASRSRFIKFASVCAAGVQFVGAYFTYTRSGYVAALLLLVAMPFAARRFRKQYVVYLVTASIALGVALPIVMSSPDIHRRLTQERTVLIRYAVTRITLNIIQRNPLFGVGLGEIDTALEQNLSNVGTLSGIYARGMYPGRWYPQPKLGEVVTSHNSILTIFAEQGLIGGFLFTGALIALLAHMIRLWPRLPVNDELGRDLMALLIIAAIGHILSTLGYDIRFFKYPSYVAWILFALGVRLGEIHAREKRAEEMVETPAEALPPRELVHA